MKIEFVLQFSQTVKKYFERVSLIFFNVYEKHKTVIVLLIFYHNLTFKEEKKRFYFKSTIILLCLKTDSQELISLSSVQLNT